MKPNSLGKSALDEPLDGLASTGAKPDRIGDLLPSSHEPAVPEVYADNKPQRSTRFIGKEK
jgi:hypothetical protein